MIRSPQWVGATALAKEFGFTPRHWIRMACAGRVPGARQPFGPRSSWTFDITLVRAWWKASEQRPEAWRPSVTRTAAVKKRSLPRHRLFEEVDLKKVLANVLATHASSRKRPPPGDQS